jgi:hypothetical protein
MVSPSNRSTRATAVFETWNRKVHYYLGLYVLLFVWLFSLTGLLLNHPRWALSRIPNDANPPYERTIEWPSEDTELARATDVARQLGLTGEIEWPQPTPAPGRLDFNIVYPKRASQVRVDLVRKLATVQQVDRSVWSAFRISHTFSGSRYNNPRMTRDWLLTSVWVFAMDALAIGLLVMVVGSYYMWYRLKPRRTLGWIVLSAGFVTCGLVVFGLSWRG